MQEPKRRAQLRASETARTVSNDVVGMRRHRVDHVRIRYTPGTILTLLSADRPTGCALSEVFSGASLSGTLQPGRTTSGRVCTGHRRRRRRVQPHSRHVVLLKVPSSIVDGIRTRIRLRLRIHQSNAESTESVGRSVNGRRSLFFSRCLPALVRS